MEVKRELVSIGKLSGLNGEVTLMCVQCPDQKAKKCLSY